MNESSPIYKIIYEYYKSNHNKAEIISSGKIDNNLSYLQIEYYKGIKEEIVQRIVVNTYYEETKNGTMSIGTTEKLDINETYIKFDKSELQFFYEKGFKLTEEH